MPPQPSSIHGGRWKRGRWESGARRAEEMVLQLVEHPLRVLSLCANRLTEVNYGADSAEPTGHPKPTGQQKIAA